MNDKQFIALTKKIEAKHVEKIRRPLQRVTKEFLKDLKNGGIEAARRGISDTVIISGIATPIKQLYKQVGLYSAILTYEKLPKEVKRKGYTPNEIELKRSAFFGFNEEWNNRINEYFNSKRFLQYAITPIGRSYRERLLAFLKQSVEEGLTIEQTIELINGNDLATWKANQIVRTERAAAYGLGQFIGADSSKFEMVKEWQEVNDARTRRTHRHSTGIGGEKRDLYDRFSNGLMFPGDKVEGKVSEVVNCRCRMALTPKRDANGRLIRKPDDPYRVGSQMALNRTATATLLSVGLTSLITNLLQADE